MQQQGGWRHRFGYVTSALDTDALYIYIYIYGENSLMLMWFVETCIAITSHKCCNVLLPTRWKQIFMLVLSRHYYYYAMIHSYWSYQPPFQRIKPKTPLCCRQPRVGWKCAYHDIPILTIISTIVHKSCTRYQPLDYNHYCSCFI